MPPIVFPSSAKRIAIQILVMAKLNGRKNFILRVFVLFKVSNLSTKIRHERVSMLTIFNINDVNDVVLASLLLTVNIFKLCSNCWLWTGKRLLGSYWKDKRIWRQDRAYHALSCSISSVNKNLSTNYIWTYTIITLPVNQLKIFTKEFTLDADSGKKMQLTFKMTCCMNIRLFIDFAR